MPSPCNSLNVTPIKVSQLVRYKNIDATDFILTIESGSALYSRKSTFGDLIGSFKNVTGSYSGSFSGSYWGNVISKNTKASGSFSGSYWGNVISKNTKASGSFSGSYWGSVISKNTKATGSFSGNITSTNVKASGSFSGSYWGSIISKNTKVTGSFKGTNNNLSGSFSGSYWGSVISKNTKASGSFSGSLNGRLIGKNSLITGSFRGIDNITNFNGTGKKVSFNGTASYSVSSSFATTSSYVLDSGAGGNIFSNALYGSANANTPSFSSGAEYTIGTISVPAGKTLKWFKIEASVGTGEGDYFYLYGALLNSTQITTNVYSSWGFGRYTRSTDEAGPSFSERQHFTIEGAVPAGVSTGTIDVKIQGTSGYVTDPNRVVGYVVGYY